MLVLLTIAPSSIQNIMSPQEEELARDLSRRRAAASSVDRPYIPRAAAASAMNSCNNNTSPYRHRAAHLHQIPDNPANLIPNLHQSTMDNRVDDEPSGGWSRYFHERESVVDRIEPSRYASDRRYQGVHGYDYASDVPLHDDYGGTSSYQYSYPDGSSDDRKPPYRETSKSKQEDYYNWEDSKSAEPKGNAELYIESSPSRRSPYETPRDSGFDSSRTVQSELEEPDAVPVQRLPGAANSCSSVATIEIAPGVFARLRGAEETRSAINRDFFMPCECACCSQTIFCIQDADFVLCPDCRVIQPMEGCEEGGVGGVGLGFKMEELMNCQQQIVDNLYS